MNPRSTQSRFHPAAALLLLATAIPSLTAAQIQEVSRDGVPHVLNPSQPLEPASQLELRQLWRIGGEEDDDVVFGVIDGVAIDGSGNTYLLDIQLSEVLVVSSNGEVLRTIGREGEGPGEFRRPSGVFLAPGGNIAVVQRMPGRIVLLTPGGEPAGTWPVPAPDDGVQFFDGATAAGDGIVVVAQSFSRRETGVDISSALIRVDAEGKQNARYFERSISRDFASMEFDERQQTAPRWSVAADGRVFVSDEFDAYRIRVFSEDGAVDRVIERDYEPRVRSGEEIELRAPRVRFGGRRGRGRGAPPEVIPSRTDRDVLDFYPRPDGTLWVLSSRGAYDAPDGTTAVFDVFDRRGRFIHQLAAPGQGDYDEDGVYVVGDRMFVITGVRAAREALRGSAAGEAAQEDDDEVRLLEVICYALGPEIHGSR